MDLERFRNDVYEITSALSEHLEKDDIPKLNFVRQKLIEMYQKNLVKINHSVLELICSANLIARGYTVDVEKKISDILICDVFAKKGDGSTIIEIETGFTPPEHALDTVDYYIARIISKIARYSKHCSKFSLASPVIGILPIPRLLLAPPNARDKDEISKLKAFCNKYYSNPPLEFDDIINARLHSVYLINIDKGVAKEVDPCQYIEMTDGFFKRGELDL